MHNSLKKLVYCMISITAISVVQFKAVCLEPLAVLMLEYVYFDLSVFGSLRSRRLQGVGTRKNGRARRRHACVRVSLARARSLFRPLLPSACYAGYVFGGKGKVSSLKDFVSCLDAGDCNGVDTNFMNRIASDIGSGLLYLHERGIAQRDLKIANVLVSNHH